MKIEQIHAEVEEALATGTWIDLMVSTLMVDLCSKIFLYI